MKTIAFSKYEIDLIEYKHLYLVKFSGKKHTKKQVKEVLNELEELEKRGEIDGV